jgi:hypothetical protein
MSDKILNWLKKGLKMNDGIFLRKTRGIWYRFFTL